MPSKKRQHYVPKFYLRNFSIGGVGSAIGLYNVRSELYRPEAKLKTQAYRNYFYGKDKEIEDALHIMETEAGAAIGRTIKKEEPPDRYTKDHLALLLFTIFQRERTLSAAREKNELLGKIVNELYALEKGLNPDSILARLAYKEPARVSLSIAAKLHFIVWDLAYKLVVNETETPFITSDNPVVLFNQFLEERKKYGSNTGYAAKGLQIFLPISPRIAILFYDENVYKIGSKKKKSIRVFSEDDINAINSLQLHNAEENVYFADDVKESYIKNLARKNKRKNTDKINLDKYYGPTDEEGNHILFHTYGNDIRLNMLLQFARIKKSAKKYHLGSKAVHVRDEYLCKSLDEFLKEAESGKYKFTDFWRYMIDKTAG